MKKGLRLIVLLCVIALGAMAFCACGNDKPEESPLKLTYKTINKNSKLNSGVRISYDKDKEALDMGFYAYANFDKVFKILKKNIKNKEIGMIYFDTLYDFEESEVEELIDQISQLNPKSIMVLGLSDRLLGCDNHIWTKLLPKTQILYAMDPSEFNQYTDSKKDLETVKTIWLYNDVYSGLSQFPNLEEVGIYATVEDGDKRTSTSSTYSSSSYSYSSTTTQARTNSKGETIKTVEVQPIFDFDASYKKPYDYEPLKNCKKLKRITIAPCFRKYKMGTDGAAYIFALSNVRNDIEINEQLKDITQKSYVSINLINEQNKNKFGYRKKYIVHEYLNNEVKGAYKKAKKFKKKNKKHKISDKALVYLGTPDSTMYKKKRVYHDSGNVLDEDELGKSIKMPEKAHDYKYFVYAYPTYKYFGKYDKGTKAYTETYWVQVFDLQKKIAYKPLKIASQKPENKISYSGTPPVKHAGTVSKKKIYKFIKKLG